MRGECSPRFIGRGMGGGAQGPLTAPRRRLNCRGFQDQGFENPAVRFQFSERVPEFSSGLFVSEKRDFGVVLSLRSRGRPKLVSRRVPSRARPSRDERVTKGEREERIGSPGNHGSAEPRGRGRAEAVGSKSGRSQALTAGDGWRRKSRRVPSEESAHAFRPVGSQ